MKPITYYRHREEVLNVITHGLGAILSIAGWVLLVVFSSIGGSVWHIVSFSIYGTTLVILYFASTFYHAARSKSLRRRLNILDHAAIYLLIAGTYTPFCLVTLHGVMGWILFGIVWGLAISGVILKVFFTGRFNLLSTISYILMGWVAIIAARPLYESLSTPALWLLVSGGISYSIGAVFYLQYRLVYNHAIFHIWVLAGSILHFICIFFYVL